MYKFFDKCFDLQTLKKAGCRWSKTKNAWYWRHFEKGYRRFGNKHYSLDDIRKLHGSELLAETA